MKPYGIDTSGQSLAHPCNDPVVPVLGGYPTPLEELQLVRGEFDVLGICDMTKLVP